ncbi:hypothetical protein [Flavobacterium oreochromis]|nr:hypothetical protein [Flavobacterium oreochromis]
MKACVFLFLEKSFTTMNHKLKTYVFKTLEILPSKIGYCLYHFLQNLSENKNIHLKIKSSEETFKTFLRITSELNISLKGNSIAEIGSGWLPIMPYLFIHKAAIKKVYTYDLNKHYEKNAITKFNNLFQKIYNVVIKPTNPYQLPNEVLYFPNQNIVDQDLPKDINIIFSRFVLEHVRPEDMVKMHQQFKNSLQPGSFIIHFISPSDHRAYSDTSLSLQDFLQYSQDEWNKIQTCFDYHNRWRLPQYLDLFKSLNYSIEYLHFDSVKSDSPQEGLFKKVKLHPDFKNYSIEELTAGNIIIILKV